MLYRDRTVKNAAHCFCMPMYRVQASVSYPRTAQVTPDASCKPCLTVVVPFTIYASVTASACPPG
ncbi:hypothetical protein D6D21_05201 [Aureobasidium pullulans]|uniref:Uncharacterized protein n=1 Tax=Aureobasidium pullulans TaxID=5580 RepID=A0A4S8XT00_AURPU|nr:hypothetical protein D6D22_05075 [Aureobasidium pullulans]THW43817.1 hypothetical protein D6D21_05201 [Aureobasidium pullulans]